MQRTWTIWTRSEKLVGGTSSIETFADITISPFPTPELLTMVFLAPPVSRPKQIATIEVWITRCTCYPHSAPAHPVLTACTPSSRISTSTPQHRTRNMSCGNNRSCSHHHSRPDRLYVPARVCTAALLLHPLLHTYLSTTKSPLTISCQCIRYNEAGLRKVGASRGSLRR